MGKNQDPPDYAAQAAAQGQENRDTAAYNNNANRVNQVTPLGTSTWTLREGADPKNPQPGDYIQTVALSPGQQSLYDSQNALSQNLAGVSQAGVNRVGAAMANPFDTSHLQPLQGAPGIVNNAQPGAGIQTQAPGGGPIQTSVDRSGLPSLNNDFAAQRDQVTGALLSRINPDLQRARDTRETDLANRGIDLGSTAYTRASDLLGRNENDARMSAVLAGGQEQSRLQAEARANRGALSTELSTDAGINNAGQAQGYSQGLASANFGNSAQQQQYGQQANNDATVNALLGRNVGIANGARQQGITEEAYLRSLPLNELNALRSGSQVAMPTFGSYYSSGAAPAPTFDGAVAQGNAINAQNAQNTASTNAGIGAAAGVAASTAAYWAPLLAAF